MTCINTKPDPFFFFFSNASASLANDGNNRIVTATGSGGLNGESGLTYDGTSLTNTGNTSFNRTTTGVTIQQGYVYSTNTHYAPIQANRQSSHGRIIEGWNLNSLVASIQGAHGSGSFSNHSDYRSKENVVAITDGITQLKKLKPSRFNFISDPDKYVHDGFIAHEVTPAVPSAVIGEKDAVDSEGKIDPQMLDYSKLTPLLTAALQEALAKIEVLETKVAALEAA